jgi:hypothetical protein
MVPSEILEGAVDDDFQTYFLIISVAWAVLQLGALWLMRGGWRWAASLSAAAMGLALAVAVLGGLAGSNIAPIWVFFAMPVCFGWIVIVWAARLLAELVVAVRTR